MRGAVFAALAAAALGCHMESLTAPNARPVPTVRAFVVPDSVVYVIDGVRQPVGTTITLRAEDIVAVEVIKNRAARARLFGSDARGGLVYVFTKNSRRGLTSK